jgi:hypothetical protein
MGELADQAAVTVWLDGKPLSDALGARGAALQGLAGAQGTLRWVGGQVVAGDKGATLDLVTKSEGGTTRPQPYEATLVDHVPANALAFASFSNLADGLHELRNTLGNANPQADRQIAQLESALGVSLDSDVIPLFAHEGALWVGAGTPIPTAALVLTVDDETKARQTLDRLGGALAMARGLPAPKATEIDGVQAQELSLGSLSLFWAVFDGRAVLSLGREGIAKTKDPGETLGSSDVYKSATDAAGLPDETSGYVFLDLRNGVPLLLDLAQLGGDQVPDDVRANLEPLDSLLAYTQVDGDVTRVRAFLGVR